MAQLLLPLSRSGLPVTVAALFFQIMNQQDEGGFTTPGFGKPYSGDDRFHIHRHWKQRTEIFPYQKMVSGI